MKKILNVQGMQQLPGPYCGPASMSMILAYYKHNVSQEQVAGFIDKGSFEKDGVDRRDLVLFARREGFIASPRYNLMLDDIIKNIDSGFPILARVKSGREQAHYCVIKGYQTDPNLLWVNDPGDKRGYIYPYRVFRQIWNRTKCNGCEGSKYYGIIIRKK